MQPVRWCAYGSFRSPDVVAEPGKAPVGASRGNIEATARVSVYLFCTVYHYGGESTRMEHVSEAVVVHVSGDDVDEALARTVRQFIAEVSKPEEPCSEAPVA